MNIQKYDINAFLFKSKSVSEIKKTIEQEQTNNYALSQKVAEITR